VRRIDAARLARQQKIAAELADIGFALPGSLTVKAYRCGKANCGCNADPPRLHGPYAFWTRKMDGKTVTRMLSAEEVADYGPLFENSRRVRVLTAELQELSLGLVEPSPARPRSNPKQRRSVKTTRTGRTRTTRSQA